MIERPRHGRDYERKAASLQTLEDCAAWRDACDLVPGDRAERLAAVARREAEIAAAHHRGLSRAGAQG